VHNATSHNNSADAPPSNFFSRSPRYSCGISAAESCTPLLVPIACTVISHCGTIFFSTSLSSLNLWPQISCFLCRKQMIIARWRIFFCYSHIQCRSFGYGIISHTNLLFWLKLVGRQTHVLMRAVTCKCTYEHMIECSKTIGYTRTHTQTGPS
jgi:hypothetical protein